MTRAYCDYCGRKSTDCPGPSDCASFTAGRRAGLKEAFKAASSLWGRGQLTPYDLRSTIRAALKAPKRGPR